MRIIKVLGPRLRPGLSVLDAGSGSGFFSSYFLSQGCRTSTLDYSSQALELSRQNTRGKSEAYIQGDLTSAALAQKYASLFDIVFSDGLLEHFEPALQKRILDNFKLMAKPGGEIITFVPNVFTWWTLVRPFVMKGIKEKPLTVFSLRHKYRQSGLRIVECGGVSVLPFAASPEDLLGKHLGMLVYAVGRA